MEKEVVLLKTFSEGMEKGAGFLAKNPLLLYGAMIFFVVAKVLAEERDPSRK